MYSRTRAWAWWDRPCQMVLRSHGNRRLKSSMNRTDPNRPRPRGTPGLLEAPSLSAIVLRRALDELPAAPKVLQRIESLAANRLAGLKDYAEAISMDAVISARILRVANSPFFGTSGRVTNISRAAGILGLQELVRITRALTVATSFKTQARRVAQAHWHHSVRVAVASRELAKLGSSMHDINQVWTPALMHDIGQLMFASMFPQHARAMWDYAKAEGITIGTAEQKLRYPAHDRLGALLCRKWALPGEIEEVILGVHLAGGTTVQTRRSLLTRVVATADVLVRIFEGGLNPTALDREYAAAQRLLACDREGVDRQLRALREPLQGAGVLAAGFI